MVTEITMPQLGESVTEGTITKWLVKPGDKVNKYDPLAEVMTDKVNAEVPSSYTGVIKELIAQEDEKIDVGKVICYMDVEGQTVKQEEDSPSSEDKKTSDAVQEQTSSSQEVEDSSHKKRYSPAVLRLSQEHGIDLTEVNGSGKGGRVTRKDLLALIEKGFTPESNEISESSTAAKLSARDSVADAEISNYKKSATSSDDRVIEVPVSGVRKTIAENMVKSKHEAPHAWMMIEVDVTNLVRYREKIKGDFLKNEGIKLTFLPFFMKATIDALKKYPEVNSKWAGDKIIQYKDVHLSMAVATDNGLFVPVIKHADEKNIKGLARELNDIAKKARNNLLKQEDVQDGTFTLNNTGSFGSIQSQPIINSPQAAILSVESIVKRPVVLENDAIAIRHMVNLCMSLDHRVLDGLISGKFMGHIKYVLENMNENTLNM
ncbi:branched-chain alpha-keto acid dehydrogenase subunit E2 [Salipaludibacillus neizhouensis]|uniref:Dihydrolipoamide acetyltransferase component of pyruvate dehydrogenase complex n=1 Tax=Salipaludibacillus neizhouensis TaxID=885475 RepID=A0A3A9K9D0_9BACI|nr:dihydrolipoamide acetyltransferase family protein [Salipaludibacillus neizhouensis]RKL68789.1 branched-chain alpha-keto acid dehydrogenase subunit E2 [Salipaludibacillus neizhouensis]